MYVDPDERAPLIIGGPALNRATTKVAAKIAEWSDIQDLYVVGSAIVGFFTGKPAQTFSVNVNPKGVINVTSQPATSDEFEASYRGLFMPAVSGSAVNKADKAFRKVLSGTEASKAAKNTNKMLDKDLNKVLGEGWHEKGSTAKKKYLKTYEKELRGNTNADFYMDKNNGDIFLKSNQSNNWVKTKDNIKDFE
ncbi:MAG: hypothetical protein LBS50_10370 [Prevotellaceae bacterium]|jgi:hypothetical protein|nr:hypothetical protein [Prevotellaceae bacterium]